MTDVVYRYAVLHIHEAERWMNAMAKMGYRVVTLGRHLEMVSILMEKRADD